MVRTQISFDERDYALAKKEARNLGISLSELVRRSLRRSLPAPGKAPPGNPPPGNPPWMRYAGFIESGDPNASQTID
jgi:Mn-dependent DtxR family transcriptional regulator